MSRRYVQTLSVALTAIVATVVVGCGRDDGSAAPQDEGGPTGSLTTPAPPALPDQFAQVDQNDPESVMEGAARALFSYRPVEEANQLAAANRAAPLLDARYYEETAGSMITLAPITGNQWQRWRSEQATVTATAQVTDDEHPADAPARVSRVLSVQLTATKPSGQVIDTASFAAYMSATKLGVWRVNAVAVR